MWYKNTQDYKMSFLLVNFSQLAHEFKAIPIKTPVEFFIATWQDDFKIYVKVNVMNSKGNFVKEQRRETSLNKNQSILQSCSSWNLVILVQE